MEVCVVCLVQFTTSQNDISLVRNEDQIPFVYRKILRIFCEYFNLPSKHNQSEEENEILSSFPFCVECRNLVAELCIFHDQIESIQKLVQKTIAKITMKIISTEKDIKNSSNSDSLENQENRSKMNTKKKLKYRRQILQNFNPRVHLADCQSQSQTDNQKKVPGQTTDENEINSLETTNFGNENPLNDEDYHDNDVNDDDRDKQNDSRVEMLSPKSESESEYKDSQEMLERAKNPESLASASLDENSARERKGESLIQRIRRKFNPQPNFPPLQNPSGAKDPSDCVTLIDSNSTNSDSQSDKQHQNQNGGRKFLEHEVPTDLIDELGDGKFVYRESWPFRIVDDSDVFQCDTCQRKIEFHKNPNEKIHTYIIRHIQKHMNSYGKGVKYESDGKFRFLDKWTFEKTESGFKCGHCSRIYTKIKSMKCHIQSWHIPGEFQCQKCPRSFTAQGYLDRHSCAGTAHSNSCKYFELSPGKFVYNGKKQKWNFELIDGIFQCGVCPALRKDKTQMREHIYNCHDAVTIHMCEECGKIVGRGMALIRHKQIHLKQKQGQCEGQKKKSESKSPSLCPLCGKTCKSSSGLGTHMFRKHKDQNILMTIEKSGTTTQENGGQKNPKNPKNPNIWKYACGKCPRKFASPVFLKKHEKAHDETHLSSIKCPQCGKKFKQSWQLQIHLDRHNKVCKYFCEVCNKGFLQKWEMTRHKENGLHSKKVETVNSKEKSIHLNASTKTGKRKRKEKGESFQEEKETTTRTTTEPPSADNENENNGKDKTDENESGDSDRVTTEVWTLKSFSII